MVRLDELSLYESRVVRANPIYFIVLNYITQHFRICPQGQLSTMQLEFLSFSKRYVLAVRGEEQPLRRNKSKKKSVAPRTPVITLRILGVDPLACKKSLKGEEMTPGIDTT